MREEEEEREREREREENRKTLSLYAVERFASLIALFWPSFEYYEIICKACDLLLFLQSVSL